MRPQPGTTRTAARVIERIDVERDVARPGISVCGAMRAELGTLCG
jgi:hypothetical protein